ncbi:hypothetical protein [Ammoniphilus sp. CFH 90114]|uniref:hypothetical protein n=1 Tax=Ammoniphilus sp. CFH 90114 TaxID=2493665 RepID=UPI0013E92167|nr:hypothetical protein [Ammoniphilus sp. CFH 90114]
MIDRDKLLEEMIIEKQFVRMGKRTTVCLLILDKWYGEAKISDSIRLIRER